MQYNVKEQFKTIKDIERNLSELEFIASFTKKTFGVDTELGVKFGSVVKIEHKFNKYDSEISIAIVLGKDTSNIRNPKHKVWFLFPGKCTVGSLDYLEENKSFDSYNKNEVEITELTTFPEKFVVDLLNQVIDYDAYQKENKSTRVNGQPLNMALKSKQEDKPIEINRPSFYKAPPKMEQQRQIPSIHSKL